MAQKVQIELLSDLALAADPESRVQAERTVAFALDDERFEIDLSSRQIADLKEALAPYMAAARRKGGRAPWGGPRARRQQAGAPARKAVDTVKVREWARENGIEIKDRGRVPGDVLARYRADQDA